MKLLTIKRLRWIPYVTAGMLAPFAAQANDGWYVGAEGGINFEKNNDFTSPANGQNGLHATYKDGYVFGLNTGYSFASGFRPELALDYRRNSLDSLSLSLAGLGSASASQFSGAENAYTAMGNLWYDVKSSQGLFSFVHPYLGGGVGAARVGARGFGVSGAPDLINEYQTAFAWQAGAGLLFDLDQNIAFSVDYRYLRTNHLNFDAAVGNASTPLESRYTAQSAMLNIAYYFGAPAAPPPPPEEPAAPPPPPPAPVTPPPPPQPPADSDGDGVPDPLDKCPNTPHGFKVDANGCIIKQTVVLQAVNFKTNSDQLTDTAQQKLDEVAAGLVGQPTLKVEIDGHTDSTGSKAYNMKLSERRAASVRKYLVSKGVDPSNLTSRGFGPTKPVASNATAEGRAQNRRVEFVVVSSTPADVKVINKAPAAQ
jgi:outer membrane protein OmpA-like peptidoglycan-associated protein